MPERATIFFANTPSPKCNNARTSGLNVASKHVILHTVAHFYRNYTYTYADSQNN